MKHLFKILIFGFLVLSFVSFIIPSHHIESCKDLHKGTFIYGDSEDEIKVVIKGKKHIEYHDNGKYFIKSKLDWIDDCSFNMTMKKVTIPNFPFGKGDVMNVQVDKIENNQIYYTANVKDISWDGILIKVK